MITVSRNGKTKRERKSPKHGGGWKGRKKGQYKKLQISSTEQKRKTNMHLRVGIGIFLL